MPYLQSNIPYFKAWVRREYTCNFERYHGEFLHCMVIAVTTMPNRSLSFQVIFTGCESDDTDEPNVHGGATIKTSNFMLRYLTQFMILIQKVNMEEELVIMIIQMMITKKS